MTASARDQRGHNIRRISVSVCFQISSFYRNILQWRKSRGDRGTRPPKMSDRGTVMHYFPLSKYGGDFVVLELL